MSKVKVLAVLSSFVALWFCGSISAQQQAGTTAAAEQPCVVDERLSLWLSLETADRMIMALERDRLGLASDLAEVRNQLELLGKSEDGLLDDSSIGQLSVALNAAAEGEEKMDETYIQLEARLVEIERTLKRRHAQRATLEDQIDRLSEEED